MKDMGIIQGSEIQAVPLIVGKDTVYEHTEIKKLEVDNQGKQTENLFEYHEIQYEKDEYFQLINEKNRADIDYIAIMGGIEL